MRVSLSTCAAAMVAVLLASGPAVAADDGWQHTMAVYMVGAGIDGKAGVGSVTADVDVHFHDILDNLEFGAMGAYRGERGRWAVVVDLMYLELEQKNSGLGPLGGTRIKAEGDQLITELDGSYALTDRLDAYGGLRYWQIDSDVEIVGGGPLGSTLSASDTEEWVDPVFGLRYVMPLSQSWELIARGDIGGFGVGSDFTWHVTAYAGWNVFQHGTVMLGFRYIDVDYDDGSGSGRFLWDVSEGGPAAGFAWRF